MYTCYIVSTLLFVFLASMIVHDTNSLLQSCEAENICIIHNSEKTFSCGEEGENATTDHLPAEYTLVWECLTRKSPNTTQRPEDDLSYYHRCYRNDIWYSTLVTLDRLIYLHKAINSLQFPILHILSNCLARSPILLSNLGSLKAHGGIILPDMSLESDSILDEMFEELAFDSNNITTIDNEWFSGYKRLRSLSLTYNQITVIEKCSLPVSGTVINFNISYNDLDCCSILHLKHMEAFWGKDVVYGDCKVNDKITNFADNFTMQCSDRGHFDCIDTTTTVSTGSHTLITEDTTVTTTTLKQTEFSPEEFVRTLFLIGLGAAAVVATGVTIGILKLVRGGLQRVSIGDNIKEVNIKKQGKECLEHAVEKLIDSIKKSDLDDINFMTYPSNNVPPIGHQFNVRVVNSAYSNRGPTADHVNYTYIDTLPYTVEGYLDLSRV